METKRKVEMVDKSHYAVYITEEVQKLIGKDLIKEAYVKFEWILSKNGPYDNYVNQIITKMNGNGFDIDSDTEIYITFISGNTIHFYVSEWGTITKV